MFHPFLKSDITVWLEFEVNYYNVAVQHIRKYTSGIPLSLLTVRLWYDSYFEKGIYFISFTLDGLLVFRTYEKVD